MDAQQMADQNAKAAEEAARAFAAFYAKLIESKMDEHTASQLTILYGKQAMQGGQKEA